MTQVAHRTLVMISATQLAKENWLKLSCGVGTSESPTPPNGYEPLDGFPEV